MNKTIRQQIVILMITTLLCIVTLPLFNNYSYACSCAAPMSHSDALDKSSYVFDGTVIAVKEQLGNKAKVNFNVNGVWKGDVEEKTTITVNTRSESCGIKFEEGKRYAVFAYANSEGLSTDRCSNTTLLSSTSSVIEQLGEATGEPIKLAGVTESSDVQSTSGNVLFIILIVIGIGLIVYRRMSKR